MEQAGHCHTAPSRSAEHGKSPVKNCCVATCMAIAVEPATTPDLQPVLQLDALFSPPTFRVGRLSEIATPPPKLR
jgi:hypothetical protein